jgi:AraC-like DNA-binding protein
MLQTRHTHRYQNLAGANAPLDRIIFATESVIAAKFRCSINDPRFRDSGPTGHFLVTFPRTSVWITYSGARSIVADPTISTIYNPGQEYTRDPLSADGDRCEWLGVSPVIAQSIGESLDPRAQDHPDKPFARQFATVDPRLYLSQRRFFTALERREVDSFEAEERIVALVATVLRNAYEPRRESDSASSEEFHRDLVQRARAEIARSATGHETLERLATRLGISPFHLCRIFRERTGTTMHRYRMELRLRLALEKLADSHADISRLALELGFSSHSHFSAMLRRYYGETPSAVRSLL